MPWLSYTSTLFSLNKYLNTFWIICHETSKNISDFVSRTSHQNFLTNMKKNCIYIFCPCEEHDRLSVHFSLKSVIKLDTNTQVNEVPYNESAEYKKLTR